MMKLIDYQQAQREGGVNSGGGGGYWWHSFAITELLLDWRWLQGAQRQVGKGIASCCGSDERRKPRSGPHLSAWGWQGLLRHDVQ